MKLFGKQLFERAPKETVMWDFAQFGVVQQAHLFNDVFTFVDQTGESDADKIKRKNKKKKDIILVTPKGLHKMQALNHKTFKIICDEKYLQDAIEKCQDKLALMPRGTDRKEGIEFGGLRGAEKYGRKEIESILERLSNRRKIASVQTIIDKYPHTTSQLIGSVLEKYKHLRFEKSSTYVPDFPREAIQAMKEYNRVCQYLCGKDTVFYVVGQDKHFTKASSRRDPILLAQSPFGFFWQILGAWDEEMEYLDEL